MSIGQNLSGRTGSNSAGSDDHHPNDSPVQSTFFPLSEWQSIAVFARDESGLIVGGVLGEIGCDWLYIRVLVVQQDLRGKGIGSNILKIAEKEGQKQNCVGVHVETLEFQAKEFYESQGYTIFAFQENYPLGHKRYFMQKLFNLS